MHLFCWRVVPLWGELVATSQSSSSALVPLCLSTADVCCHARVAVPLTVDLGFCWGAVCMQMLFVHLLAPCFSHCASASDTLCTNPLTRLSWTTHPPSHSSPDGDISRCCCLCCCLCCQLLPAENRSPEALCQPAWSLPHGQHQASLL